MNAFSIGTSALLAAQNGLSVIGQNVSNANTPGYHRQAVNFSSVNNGAPIGNGVDVASITRYTAPPVETALFQANGDQGASTGRLDVLQQLEAALSGGTQASGSTASNSSSTGGGISDALNSFFNQVTQLTAKPNDPALLQTVVGAASELAGQFNAVDTSLTNLSNTLGTQISQAVSTVNGLTTRIANLNGQIANAEGAGQQPNDLLDQRDQLVTQLSQQVDVRVIPQPNGVVNLLSTGGALVVGETANQFQTSATPTGGIGITLAGTTRAITFSSGSLAGQLQAYNQDIPAAQTRLNGLASQLIQKANTIQATGLGQAGPLTSVTGTNGVASATQFLATQNLPFPVTAGNLTVSVTATATGNRTNTTIAIDPATQSLQDVVTALNGVTGLTASVGTGNVLQITAQPGYQFDFAGRDTNPPTGVAVASPDSAGLLTGLGVNGLFTGTDASSIAVQPTISANPQTLATSATGQQGDTAKLEQLAALGTQPIFSGRTLSAEYTDLQSGVGTSVSGVTDQKTSQAGLVQNLNTQAQSVGGVDVNQELVSLLSYQRMIQGASQYMSVVNTALDSLFTIIK